MPHPGVTIATLPIDDDDKLISGVLDELLNSALLTATTTSLVNWLANNRESKVDLNLAFYVPPVPLLFPVVQVRLLTSGRYAAMAGTVREYFDRLVFLRALTLHYAQQNERRFEQPGVDFEVLVASWQALCGVAAAALEGLMTAVDEPTRTRALQRFKRLNDYLGAAESQQHPSITADGIMTVPFWAERRQRSRSTVNVHAQFMVGESIQRVAVIDATSHGFGVIGLTGVQRGSEIFLVVEPGQMIPATVAWVKGDHAGVAFGKALPKNIAAMLAFASALETPRNH